MAGQLTDHRPVHQGGREQTREYKLKECKNRLGVERIHLVNHCLHFRTLRQLQYSAKVSGGITARWPQAEEDAR